jgi:hypothetical protein
LSHRVQHVFAILFIAAGAGKTRAAEVFYLLNNQKHRHKKSAGIASALTEKQLVVCPFARSHVIL